MNKPYKSSYVQHISPDLMKEMEYQVKALLRFYYSHKAIKGRDEIEDRINYIIKNKVQQRNELETLYWVIGEMYDENH